MGIFDNIPNNVLILILSYLDYADLEVLLRVNMKFRAAALWVFKNQRITPMLSGSYSKLEPLKELSGILGYPKKYQTEMAIHHSTSMTTGRSLLLNRFLDIPDIMSVDFSRDSYMTTLEISRRMLTSMSRKRILDVGCGLSIFASEAAVIFNIDIDRIDLGASLFSPQHRYVVVKNYIEGMAALIFLKKKFPQRLYGCLGTEEAYEMISLIEGNLNEIVTHYMLSSVTRPVICASSANLSTILDNTYDGVLSTWLLMYLEKKDQIATLREMVRVTKIDGEIRILPGNTLLRRHRISRKEVLEWAEYGNKNVEIIKFEYDGLMVLRVIKSSFCCIM